VIRTAAQRGAAGVVVLAVLTIGPAALGSVAAASLSAQHQQTQQVSQHHSPRAHPSSNTRPSAAFVAACRAMGRSQHANAVCDQAAVKDFDKVRRREGVKPLVLPRDFVKLSPPLQLLAIANLERVDRGLQPILGLTAQLNALARHGANHHSDPSFPNPFVGTTGSANWASAGNSVLLDDFYWMYDDGYGSFNGDCPTKQAPGCWGHRDGILLRMDSGRVMGAAAAFGQGGASMTEEFIGGYQRLHHDPVLRPTWKSIAATIPRS
jgi:hypothetical protein